MRYVSTRGGGAPAAFLDILLGGLMGDGGLAMPEAYPKIDAAELARWRGLTYPALAFEILRRYADDISAGELKRIVDKTYTAEVFHSADITPVRELESGVFIAGLSNGPSLAFKVSSACARSVAG
jgi:threonine synthase